MKGLFNKYFLVYLSSWIIVHALRKAGLIIPWANSYLTDLVAVPAMAHLSVTITRNLIVKDQRYTYPLPYLLFIATYLSIVFELLMPKISDNYIGDIGDIAAYFGGAIFYYFVQEHHNRQKSTGIIASMHHAEPAAEEIRELPTVREEITSSH